MHSKECDLSKYNASVIFILRMQYEEGLKGEDFERFANELSSTSISIGRY